MLSGARPYWYVNRRRSPTRWLVRKSVSARSLNRRSTRPEADAGTSAAVSGSGFGRSGVVVPGSGGYVSALARASFNFERKVPTTPAFSAASASISLASAPVASGVGDLYSRYFVVENSR